MPRISGVRAGTSGDASAALYAREVSPTENSTAAVCVARAWGVS